MQGVAQRFQPRFIEHATVLTIGPGRVCFDRILLKQLVKLTFGKQLRECFAIRFDNLKCGFVYLQREIIHQGNKLLRQPGLRREILEVLPALALQLV